MRASLSLLAPSLLLAALLAGCGDEPAPEPAAAPHPMDLETLKSADGVPASFDRNQVMSDAFFTDADALDAAGVQAFLERTPYGNRSWIADVSLAGKPAARAIVDVAAEVGINPLVLLTRIQVESSQVSKSARPSQSKIDFLMGCGCPDYQACNARYRGFENQLRCSGQTFRGRYDDSVSGAGQWRRGIARRTLDPLTVTPVNHATAAHYAYTPWVLQGRGGNWLAWNVARLYARHADALGLFTAAEPPLPDRGPACGTFEDVGVDHFAYGAIEAGVQANLWSGCADKQFCPDDEASRAAVASIIARTLRLPLAAGEGLFDDVPATHWAAPAIEALYREGIIAGCSAGRFCPGAAVQRAQLAVMVTAAAGYDPKPYSGRFDDVPPSHWAADWLEAAADAGVMIGCAADRFCPGAAATRAQVAVVVARAFSVEFAPRCD